MTDRYIPDNAPRDILLSLQELSEKNIPHAGTFKRSAARIAELEAALKPFADAADDVPPATDAIGGGLCSVVMQRKHYFNARAALKGEK